MFLWRLGVFLSLNFFSRFFCISVGKLGRVSRSVDQSAPGRISMTHHRLPWEKKRRNIKTPSRTLISRTAQNQRNLKRELTEVLRRFLNVNFFSKEHILYFGKIFKIKFEVLENWIDCPLVLVIWFVIAGDGESLLTHQVPFLNNFLIA